MTAVLLHPLKFLNKKIKSTLIEICRRVESKGFVAATDGNISARLPNGNILATPTSLNKGFVTIDDLVELTIDGEPVSGKRKPSTEIKMHLYIYKHRPDINAVVHCHPVYATGFAAARKPLTPNVFPEVIVQFGEIPLAEYATPSTPDLGESLQPYIARHNAILLANHGAVTCGKDLWEAYFAMEKVEQTAHMLFVAESLGGTQQLTKEQIEKLQELATTVYKR
jgi:L-fuculose-phosphate aldolase